MLCTVEGKGSIAVYASKNGTDAAETKLGKGKVTANGEGAVALYASGGSNIELNGTTLSVRDKGLLFYSENDSKLDIKADSVATVGSGGTAFYVKKPGGSPLESIILNPLNGKKLAVNLNSNSTLIVAEGEGGVTGGELLSNLSDSHNSAAGIIINDLSGTGDYTAYRAYRLPLEIDTEVNLDDVNDKYLNSEFSSSSVTLHAGKTISGSGKITTPPAKAKKSKVAIAQKIQQSV